jgi:hypothetical protein
MPDLSSQLGTSQVAWGFSSHAPHERKLSLPETVKVPTTANKTISKTTKVVIPEINIEN